jgi:hypothetical protein
MSIVQCAFVTLRVSIRRGLNGTADKCTGEQALTGRKHLEGATVTGFGGQRPLSEERLNGEAKTEPERNGNVCLGSERKLVKIHACIT